MNIQKQRDCLTSFAYWGIISAAVYLGLEYLLPISIPIIFGVLVAWLVIWISNRMKFPNRIFRVALTLVIYGIFGLLITLIITRGVNLVSTVIKWLPQVYDA